MASTNDTLSPLAERLLARDAKRARVGAGARLYERLGIADPYQGGEVGDRATGDEGFSFLSSAGYFDELRGLSDVRRGLLRRIGALRASDRVAQRFERSSAMLVERAIAGAAEFADVEQIYVDWASQQPPSDDVEVFAQPVARARTRPVADAPTRTLRADIERSERVLAQLQRSVARRGGRRPAAAVEQLRMVRQLAPEHRAQGLRALLATDAGAGATARRFASRRSPAQRAGSFAPTAVAAGRGVPGQNKGLRTAAERSPLVMSFEQPPVRSDVEPPLPAGRARTSPPAMRAHAHREVPVARAAAEARVQGSVGRAGPPGPDRTGAFARTDRVRSAARPTERIARSALRAADAVTDPLSRGPSPSPTSQAMARLDARRAVGSWSDDGRVLGGLAAVGAPARRSALASAAPVAAAPMTSAALSTSLLRAGASAATAPLDNDVPPTADTSRRRATGSRREPATSNGASRGSVPVPGVRQAAVSSREVAAGGAVNQRGRESVTGRGASTGELRPLLTRRAAGRRGDGISMGGAGLQVSAADVQTARPVAQSALARAVRRSFGDDGQRIAAPPVADVRPFAADRFPLVTPALVTPERASRLGRPMLADTAPAQVVARAEAQVDAATDGPEAAVGVQRRSARRHAQTSRGAESAANSPAVVGGRAPSERGASGGRGRSGIVADGSGRGRATPTVRAAARGLSAERVGSRGRMVAPSVTGHTTIEHASVALGVRGPFGTSDSSGVAATGLAARSGADAVTRAATSRSLAAAAPEQVVARAQVEDGSRGADVDGATPKRLGARVSAAPSRRPLAAAERLGHTRRALARNEGQVRATTSGELLAPAVVAPFAARTGANAGAVGSGRGAMRPVQARRQDAVVASPTADARGSDGVRAAPVRGVEGVALSKPAGRMGTVAQRADARTPSGARGAGSDARSGQPVAAELRAGRAMDVAGAMVFTSPAAPAPAEQPAPVGRTLGLAARATARRGSALIDGEGGAPVVTPEARVSRARRTLRRVSGARAARPGGSGSVFAARTGVTPTVGAGRFQTPDGQVRGAGRFVTPGGQVRGAGRFVTPEGDVRGAGRFVTPEGQVRGADRAQRSPFGGAPERGDAPVVAQVSEAGTALGRLDELLDSPSRVLAVAQDDPQQAQLPIERSGAARALRRAAPAAVDGRRRSLAGDAGGRSARAVRMFERQLPDTSASVVPRPVATQSPRAEAAPVPSVLHRGAADSAQDVSGAWPRGAVARRRGGERGARGATLTDAQRALSAAGMLRAVNRDVEPTLTLPAAKRSLAPGANPEGRAAAGRRPAPSFEARIQTNADGVVVRAVVTDTVTGLSQTIRPVVRAERRVAAEQGAGSARLSARDEVSKVMGGRQESGSPTLLDGRGKDPNAETGPQRGSASLDAAMRVLSGTREPQVGSRGRRPAAHRRRHAWKRRGMAAELGVLTPALSDADFEPVDGQDVGAPGWARRASTGTGTGTGAEAPDLSNAKPEAPQGQRTSGLVNALARTESPADLVRVIVERRTELRELRNELPNEAVRLAERIGSISGPEREALLNNRRVIEPTVTQGNLLQPSRVVRGFSAPTQLTAGRDGLGATKITKLANKLMNLIHLAENARQRDAQDQVRMAQDSLEGRAEGGAKFPGLSVEDHDMNIEELQKRILNSVMEKFEEINSRRGPEEKNGNHKWW